MQHVLIVGGTGMLSEVSLWLAKNNDHVSVVARDQRKMERMVNKSVEKSNIIPVLVDYSHDDELRRAILLLTEKYGSIDLVIAWIHSYAENALGSIIDIVSNNSDQWELYHILGSSSDINEIKKSITVPKNCRYHQIQLGFIIKNNMSRWLTHDEISSGVIDAIKNNEASPVVIGEIEPWDRRP
ncbi:short-chain dehydrogenase [Bacillus sp. REN10]|uniref:short-chain dehydrogenase n=1 Tax=Bacillus sp. REN10 TaxID=2782541 RepID=UPI00193B309D|nr:short-chain dehydrogenase [Bacillus sp. REN10]